MQIMRLKFNKCFFSLVAMIFGFTGSVAAQYGVVENHYMVKGNVISEKCKDAIPKVKVTLRTTDAQGDHDLVAFTDEKGNFSIDNYNLSLSQNYFLLVEDVDGPDNKGDYQPTRQAITLTHDDFVKAGYENWDQYFDSKTIFYFGLKSRTEEPCK